MSAWAIVWLAVQFTAAPGANDEPLAGTHTRSLTCESVTVTDASVVLPVFLATIRSEERRVGKVRPDSVATFVIDKAGLCVPGVVTSAHFWAAPPAPSSTQAWL